MLRTESNRCEFLQTTNEIFLNSANSIGNDDDAESSHSDCMILDDEEDFPRIESNNDDQSSYLFSSHVLPSELSKGTKLFLGYESRLVEVELVENIFNLVDHERLTICHLKSLYSIPKRHLFLSTRCQAEKLCISIETRVLIRFGSSKNYKIGFVREIPSAENLFRHLILLEDGTSVYTGPKVFLHLCLCQNLKNHLRSIEMKTIRDDLESNFFSSTNEINSYRTHQLVRVQKFGERFHETKIVQIDCSLIKIRFFQRKAQTEIWIHHKSKLIDSSNPTSIQFGPGSMNSVQPICDVEISSNKLYEKHRCSSSCVLTVEKHFNPNRFEKNPFSLPLNFGWTLLLIERRGNGSFKRKPSTRKNHGFAMKYIYRSPCGRSFLTLKEIEEFLLTTNSKLNIKYFIADRVTSLNSTINFDANKIIHLDISQGKERVPISVLNETDRFLPEDFVYGTENVSRFVSIEQIRSRRTCCSCTDNCRDRTKCACWLKTFKQAELNDDETILNARRQNLTDEQIISRFGYVHQRLKKIVWSGIYECNSGCSCHRQHCTNRLVQHGLFLQLQLFHTEKKGWGLRALHDIPSGSFINSYVGELINEDIAAHRDYKYLAILDHKSHLLTNRSKRSTTSSEQIDKSKSQVPMKNASHSSIIDEDDDSCFILDAKDYGSVSRFYNHSCKPNVHVQNVFIETHDPRFPVISLFSNRQIRAGEELCWDYNYTVGCMPGIRIDCQCQAANCRGRLL